MLKKATKWLIVIGTTLALGCLSFAGTLLLAPTWFGLSTLVWAIAAFGFAVLIEGLVYYQNISQALKKWWNSGENYLIEALTTSMLDQFIAQDPNPIADATLYKEKKERLEKLDHMEDELEPIDWLLAPRKRWQLHQEKHQLEKLTKELEKNLISHYQTKNGLPSISQANLNHGNLFEASVQAEVKKRSHRGWVFFIKIIAILTGGSAFFAALAASQAGLAPLGLPDLIAGTSIKVSWLICWPIALFSGIGYCLLIYNNLTQLMHERAFDQPKTPKSFSYYLFRILALGLAVFVAAAIFWTWWTSGSAVAEQILPWGNLSVTIFIGALAAVMVIPTLIWNTSNAFNTIELIEQKAWQKIKNFFQKLTDSVKAAWKNAAETGNYHHFLNPFRFVENLIGFLFRGGVLVAHSASIGLTADKLGSLPSTATMSTGGAMEAMTDIHYLAHDHDDDPKEKNSRGPTQYQALPDPSPTSQPIEKLPEAEHHHFDLAGILLIFILTPLKIARCVWDFTFGLLLSWIPKLKFCESMAESFKKTFSTVTLEHYTPEPTRFAAPAHITKLASVTDHNSASTIENKEGYSPFL